MSFGRRRARLDADRASHGVQPRCAGTFVELGDVVIDVVEVVLESRLAEKGVNGVHGFGRVGRQGLVLDLQQTVPLREAGAVFRGSEALRDGVLTEHQLRRWYRPIFRDVYMPRRYEPSLVDQTAGAWLWSRRQAVAGHIAP